MIKSVLRSLRKSDWSMALDFLSPAFFEVVPTLAMTRLMAGLTRNSLDKGLYQDTLSRWQPIDRGLMQHHAPAEAGQRVLRLYFAAILGPKPCFLDLRAEGFRADGDWSPQPWIFGFSDAFLGSLQKVYQGFYEDDPELFQAGLKALDLSHAESLFLDIFGRVQEGSMLFRLEDFREFFHKIFLSCKTNRTALHPEFLPLGLLLFSLYENAEQLGIPLSPADAWKAARLYFSTTSEGASVS